MRGLTTYCVWFSLSILLTASAQNSEIDYRVHFAGIEDEKTLDTLKERSDLVSLKNSSPRNLFQLQNRVRGDRDTFIQVLHHQGYYDALVDYTLDEETNPVTVNFDVDLGTVYTFNSISVDIVDQSEDLKLVLPAIGTFGLKQGAPALAQLVVDAEQSLASHLREQGFASVSILGRDTVIDRSEKTMDINYSLRLVRWSISALL